MSVFHWRRFARILANDLELLNARKLALTTLAIVGIGLVVYLTNVGGMSPTGTPISSFLFPALLLGGGLVFTSLSYGDLHDPLARFHCLTQPCSALERFVARYVLTAPLYCIYAVVLYLLLERLAEPICRLLLDAEFRPFEPASPATLNALRAYFVLQPFAYLGAILFRSHALLRSLAGLSALAAGSMLVYFVAVRLVYWDSFVGLTTIAPGAYLDVEFPFRPSDPGPWHQALLGAFVLWVLFLAYRSLREHEVQDGF